MKKSEQKIIQDLKKKGFENIVTRKDPPLKYYPSHSHEFIAAHVVLEGEMHITMNGTPKTLKTGDQLDVPKKTMHKVTIGDTDCTFIVGEK